ncbi:ATP-dependent RNA helicase [Vibrio sp. 404]|uniref:ATP-dependent RNA helicase n=1 Tax=Vibrio marinisediminis TaxID=2758441 RepID=A0A7W2FP13_9VIBR|nr:helicase-related protein [Vibrio marinisediminis]MBA5761627.1 ATP-dependent RNA helicase [Vibrio marinisediminis]
MIDLPIDSLKNNFLSQLKTEHLVVEAETGSGKSTRLPLWAKDLGRVLVIEPRRIACTSLAQYLAEQHGEQVGQSIGYAIKLETRFQPTSQIVFVTPGVALRWYSENQLADFDIIIVDEFHERRWDTDLLVALFKKHKQHRLVVTSATIEGEKLARYIGANRLQAQGRNYQVSVIHRANESRQLPDSRQLEQRIKVEVLQALESTHGDILVFLPGRKEITQCAQMLSGLDGVLVAPLHASVTDTQRELALKQQELPKVVLATNVAETSLTIPNIAVVIDSGLERRTEQRNGRTTLSLKHISQASAKQRSGRAGRVMDGVSVRLYGEHAALSTVTPAEMHRESLTEAMLASACCGELLTQLEFLEPLPEKSLQQAHTILSDMQAIDSEGLVTEHGRMIYPLPIDALLADLVTRMPSKALKEVMIDYTAALATPAKLYRVNGNEEERELLAQQESKGCDGQIAVGLIRGKEFSGLSVDMLALTEAQALSEQMRSLFGLPQLEVASRYDHNEWLNAIATLHPELVFVRRVKRKEALANGELEVIIGRESRLPNSVESALVLDTHSVPGRGVKQTLTLATEMMPIDINKLKSLPLGEWQQGKTIVTDEGTLVQMELVYAGRVVATKQEVAQGELAIQPMLEAVKSGEKLAGLYAHRKAEIDHWRMYIELGLSEQNDHDNIEFDRWFTEQLVLLELSELDELDLFCADDFCFEGIPQWQYQDFSEQYPLSLSLGDLNLDVEYFPARKLVYVVHRDGLRKGGPKRWELPRWAGWKVQYKKASRVVDVK